MRVAMLLALCMSQMATAADIGADIGKAYCVVGANAIGCRSEREVDQILAQSGDSDALRESISAATTSGACRIFRQGESVFAVDDSRRPDLRAVRRRSDTEAYWMPATWARPQTECAAYNGKRSVEEKLGFSAPPPPQPELPDERALASSQRGESDRVETRCVIAAVMTDAEIAACRNVRHQ